MKLLQVLNERSHERQYGFAPLGPAKNLRCEPDLQLRGVLLPEALEIGGQLIEQAADAAREAPTPREALALDVAVDAAAQLQIHSLADFQLRQQVRNQPPPADF